MPAVALLSTSDTDLLSAPAASDRVAGADVVVGNPARLTEAADRGLWEEPDTEVVRQMQQVYLAIEGDLEDGARDAIDA